MRKFASILDNKRFLPFLFIVSAAFSLIMIGLIAYGPAILKPRHWIIVVVDIALIVFSLSLLSRLPRPVSSEKNEDR